MRPNWCGKSTPVAYSVSRPTAKPNMTHRPLVISLAFVHPKNLWPTRRHSSVPSNQAAAHLMTQLESCRQPRKSQACLQSIGFVQPEVSGLARAHCDFSICA